MLWSGAHPLGVKGFEYRAKLVAVRTTLKCQVHGISAGAGIAVPMSDLFSVGGIKLLDQATRQLGEVDRWWILSLRRMLEIPEGEIDRFATPDKAQPGYRVLQTVPEIGPVLAAVLGAEIGDVHRFTRLELGSWAGLTPRHRVSDITVRRGLITRPRIPAGPLGLRRSGPADRTRPPDRSSWWAGRGPPWSQPRQGHSRPGAAPSGLLRAARRTHPSPAAGSLTCPATTLKPAFSRGVAQVMTPISTWSPALIDPDRRPCGTAPGGHQRGEA